MYYVLKAMLWLVDKQAMFIREYLRQAWLERKRQNTEVRRSQGGLPLPPYSGSGCDTTCRECGIPCPLCGEIGGI
jgi:hypothetical protein